jgi:hypothetical protein
LADLFVHHPTISIRNLKIVEPSPEISQSFISFALQVLFLFDLVLALDLTLG